MRHVKTPRALHDQLWPCQSARVGKDRGRLQVAGAGREAARLLGGRPSWPLCGLEARTPRGRGLCVSRKQRSPDVGDGRVGEYPPRPFGHLSREGIIYDSILTDSYGSSLPFIDHSEILQECSSDKREVGLSASMQMHASELTNNRPVQCRDINPG